MPRRDDGRPNHTRDGEDLADIMDYIAAYAPDDLAAWVQDVRVMAGHYRTFDPSRLTPREAEIAALHDSGLQTAAIAERLGLALVSVKKVLDTIRDKQDGVGE